MFITANLRMRIDLLRGCEALLNTHEREDVVTFSFFFIRILCMGHRRKQVTGFSSATGYQVQSVRSKKKL